MANPQVRRKIQIQPRGMVLALLHRLKLSPPHFWMHLVIGHTIDGIWFVISIYDYTWLYMILMLPFMFFFFSTDMHWLHLGLQLLKNLENTQDKSHIVPPLPPMTCSQKEHHQLHHARQVWSLTLPRCNFGPSKMTTLANAFLSPHEHWMDAWEGQGLHLDHARENQNLHEDASYHPQSAPNPAHLQLP